MKSECKMNLNGGIGDRVRCGTGSCERVVRALSTVESV
jgi:hypothetical protein